MSKLFTPKFRVSFPSVFEATQINGEGKAKFRITMLFDEATFDEIEKQRWEAIKASIEPAAVKKFGKLPPMLKEPFLKGNDMRSNETGKIYQGHENMTVLRTASEDKPGLVDHNVQPIIDQSEFYGGCYAIATINPYGWEYMGKKGVSFGVGNIQKVGDGEHFGGKTKAEDDFGAISAPKGTTNSGLFDS